MICVAFFSIILPKLHFYSILCLILRFTKEETEVEKQAFPFVPARYIPTFDVNPKLIVFFYGGSGSSKNCAISEL